MAQVFSSSETRFVNKPPTKARVTASPFRAGEVGDGVNEIVDLVERDGIAPLLWGQRELGGVAFGLGPARVLGEKRRLIDEDQLGDPRRPEHVQIAPDHGATERVAEQVDLVEIERGEDVMQVLGET